MIENEIGILGGGLAGLSLAYFIGDRDTAVLEKNESFGGLCRSFNKNGITYDIGPHIIFSKNKDVLDFMNSTCQTGQYKRSNKIYHKGAFVTYPFENYLAQMKNDEDINFCLNSFLNNPYEKMPARNMLAFFLKTFGEGITRLYLQHYNEKIWKFDPSMMDTQMVERIPKPPKEDIINSANGKFTEGYLHQLYFSYPQTGGIQAVADGVVASLEKKDSVALHANSKIQEIERKDDSWIVKTQDKDFKFKKIINCMPIHEFAKFYEGISQDIHDRLSKLRFNSIYAIIINVKEDDVGDNFTVTVAQKDVIFHRINKLDFMGGEYHIPGSSTFLAEVTFREGDIYDEMNENELVNRCIDDLVKIKFIKEKASVNFTDIKKEKYAYVIYDLKHRENCDYVLSAFRDMGIESNGRFAEFEYINMDKVIEHSMQLAKKL